MAPYANQSPASVKDTKVNDTHSSGVWMVACPRRALNTRAITTMIPMSMANIRAIMTATVPPMMTAILLVGNVSSGAASVVGGC